MLEDFAKARGIPVLEIFKQAHKMYGTMYGLQSPENMYELWRKGWCVLPLYVHRFVRNELKREDIADQPLLPF